MEREVIRVEPISTWVEAFKAPISVVVRHGDTVHVSGLPPFDPKTGAVLSGSIEEQTERVLEQLKQCLEAAGSSLALAIRCTVYCKSSAHYAAVNAIYARWFPKDPPVRVFVNVADWPGPFDIEIDCIAGRPD